MSSIHSVHSSGNASLIALAKPNQLAKADFKALSVALKAGDLSAAQTAFAALKKDDPKLAKRLSDDGGDGKSTQSSPLNDLAAALDKGDLTAAQTALVSLKKSPRGHRHSHVSHDDSETPTTSASPVSTDSTETSTTGTVIDVQV